jgi:hypothetical protein
MKVILKFINKDSVNKESIDIEYNTLMDIHKKYPQYSYHMLRQVYLQSTNKNIKKMHPRTSKLYETIRIVDKYDDEIKPLATAV